MICETCGLDFFAGEEKFIEAKVVSAKRNETVVITSAAYELSKNSCTEIAETGSCEVNGDTVRLLLRTSEAGAYSLKITAKVGAETVIQRVSVSVKR